MGVASASAGGEAAAFEALFAANYDDLLRYAARRVGRDDAPDVVAEVLLVAWRRRGEYAPEQARLWLFGVAHNLVANEHRSALRRQRLAERARQDTAVPGNDPADTATDAVQVHAALAQLPPTEQEALRLSEWEQLTPAEAAQVAGCSGAAFRVRLHRARRHFAAVLAETDAASAPRASQQTPQQKGVRQ